MRYALALARENTFMNRLKSDSEQKVTKSPDEFEISSLVHIKRHFPSTQDSKWEYDLQIVHFQLLTVVYWIRS